MKIKSNSTGGAINLLIAGLLILSFALTDDCDDYAIVFHSDANHFEKEVFPRAYPGPFEDATVSVITQRLDIRSGPGINHTVIGQLHRGDVMTILSCKPDWLYVKIADRQFGWVRAKSTRLMIPSVADQLFPETPMPIFRICIN